MKFTPQMLVEQTYNYYGLKADIAAAAQFIEKYVSATPGAFYEWVNNQSALEVW